MRASAHLQAPIHPTAADDCPTREQLVGCAPDSRCPKAPLRWRPEPKTTGKDIHRRGTAVDGHAHVPTGRFHASVRTNRGAAEAMETGRRELTRVSLEPSLHQGPPRPAPEARQLGDMVAPTVFEARMTGLGMDLPERTIGPLFVKLAGPANRSVASPALRTTASQPSHRALRASALREISRVAAPLRSCNCCCAEGLRGVADTPWSWPRARDQKKTRKSNSANPDRFPGNPRGWCPGPVESAKGRVFRAFYAFSFLSCGTPAASERASGHP